MVKSDKYYLDLIKKIEKIRQKNNGNWMNILKIAFKHSPQETAKVMQNIYIDDSRISRLVKKLTN
tara:strand:+ start:114 stop:308 length:195 start_codon:yes stop_codon:yes gene_type:complete